MNYIRRIYWNTLKRIIPKTLWTRTVIKNYIKIGMYYGEMISYGFMGEPIGFSRMETKFDFWKQQYKILGFKEISIEDFEIAGGYRGQTYLSNKIGIYE